MYEVTITIDGKPCPVFSRYKSRWFGCVFFYSVQSLNLLNDGYEYAEALISLNGKACYRFGKWNIVPSK